MKKKILGLLLCMFLIATFFVVTPDTVSADQDGDYTYTVSNGEATITNYTGAGGAITIPSTLGGYPTVHIGDNAFYGNQNLTSVTIPDSVTTIGSSAFADCYSLASVTIGNSVTTIKGHAFYQCTDLTSVIIPDSVTIIGDQAYRFCDSITSVTIGNKVTTIGNASFAYCSSLSSVTIGNKVTTIGNFAFSDCDSLTSIIIPDSVTTIGSFAFSSHYLVSVTIGNGVTTIGSAFADCYSLASVTFGKSVTTIAGAFVSCYSLTSIIIPDSVITIGSGAFVDCALASVTIGRSVTTIGSAAFSSCESLTSITFLGLVAPTTVATNWITDIPNDIRGHAYTASNFPAPGDIWNGLTMGTNLPKNNPPIFGTPSPANGSTENLLNLIWSIPINDSEGDTLSWTIQCSNGQTNSGTEATNGTKSLSLSELAYSTTYKIWVNATDLTGSNQWIQKWYTFTTKGSGGGGGGVPPAPPENKKPVANLGAGEPYQGLVNKEITFNGSWSYDSDGNITNWLWVFGDNTNGTGKIIRHTYSKAGTYTVNLTVTDNDGATGNDTATVVISTGGGGGGSSSGSENKKPIANASAGEPFQGFINSQITFDGSKSYDSDGTIASWSWDFGDGTKGSGEIITHIYLSTGTFQVILTVTDDDGAKNIDQTTAVILKLNNPPTQPTISGPIFGHKNVLYNFTVTSFDADNDTIRYSIIWETIPFYENKSTFLPSGTPFMCSHRWTTAGIYEISVQAFDNNTDSQLTYLSILIDIQYVKDIGYLINRTGDSDYDMFYSNSTMKETSVQKRVNGTYLIDSDGDGDWDYTYNATSGLASLYQTSPKTPGFELVFVLCAIAITIFLCRKKRSV